MPAHRELSNREEWMELLEVVCTVAWWTVRSGGRALVSLLRGKPWVAAVRGEGLS